MTSEQLRRTIEHAVTLYDAACERQEIKRGRVNIYRIGILLRGVNETVEAVESGSSIARALYDHFNDRLLTRLEKACGCAVTYGGGAQDKGRPA